MLQRNAAFLPSSVPLRTGLSTRTHPHARAVRSPKKTAAAAMNDPKRAKLGSSRNVASASTLTGGGGGAAAAAKKSASVVPPSSRPAPACLSHEIVDSFTVPGIVMTDHLFRVPLDYSRGPEAGTIQLFARVATSPSRAAAAANATAAAAAATAAAAAAAVPTKTAPTSSSAAAAPGAPLPPPPTDDGGPWLLYLQGGPGFEAPRPTEASSWLKAALHHGFRVVLLDQRGTGRSSPPVAPPLAQGTAAGASSTSASSSPSSSLAAACGSEDPEVQARYLSFFRADSIVDDAEAVRAALVPSASASGCPSPQRGRWSVLGQSFGGFAAVTYLCRAPQGLTEVLLAGGLPPDAAGWEEEREEEEGEESGGGGIEASAPPNGESARGSSSRRNAAAYADADEVYDRLFARVVSQNAKFYRRYPRDAARARAIVLALAALPGGGAALPSGGALTPRGFQLLGLAGLGSGGGFDRLHYLLERALCPETGRVTAGFLRAYEGWMAWEANPLYALLHEAIYRDGGGGGAGAGTEGGGGRPGWAAERARQRGTATVRLAPPPGADGGADGGDGRAAAAAATTLPRPEAFDALAAARQGRDVLFTGEMVFPWMFEEVGALRPLAAVAERLAVKDDWPRLYDLAALRGCRVPVAAAVYWEDMYVDFELSQRTARRIGTLRQWVTSELMHSGIRDDGARVFEHLMGLVRGSTPLF